MFDAKDGEDVYRWHDGELEKWAVIARFVHPNGCDFVSFGRHTNNNEVKYETINNIPVDEAEKEGFISQNTVNGLVEDYCRAKFNK